jgi:quercetin dioxygenase-like cupin family protein
MQPVTRTVVLDARFAQPKTTERVEIRRITILPNHAAGAHVHNTPVVGSILKGSVIFQVEGEPPSTLRPGDVFFEPEGVRIARFDATDEGVTFLGYFLAGPGEEPQLTMVE